MFDVAFRTHFPRDRCFMDKAIDSDIVAYTKSFLFNTVGFSRFIRPNRLCRRKLGEFR